jgi:hypothetical protein
MAATPIPRKIAGFELIERWVRSVLATRPAYAAATLSSRRT